jgi:hypothetical protein
MNMIELPRPHSAQNSEKHSQVVEIINSTMFRYLSVALAGKLHYWHQTNAIV